MSKRFSFASILIFSVIAGGLIFYSISHAQYEKKVTNVKERPVDVNICYNCHAPIKELHTMGKHQKVNCVNCHRGLEAHLKGPGPQTRPVTDTSWEACGQCHKEQYDSFLKMNYHRPARSEKSLLTGRSPNPLWDKLMAPHGFTKEHAATRSHPWMLIDHLLVDRAYGGRFQPKNGWQYVNAKPGTKAWDLLEDRYPDVKEHKAFLPQTASAANPVCLNCKTQDHILDWAYMGDPDKGAKWSRTSKVFEFAKDLQHGLNCYICHDPHAAKPRIVRDGLIDALTRPDGDTLWHKDPKRTGIKVIDLGVRGYTRKIAILERYDTKLQCGQCHVEYNCNPGHDPKTGASIGMADRRTNHFPFKKVADIVDHYYNLGFRDFKHAITGASLIKAQHPEVEVFWNSKHDRAGVGCNDCHTPKVKDKKTGKVYTSHFAVTPRVQLKETCLKCHSGWTEEQARYAIDSVKDYIKGKMRKAEFWLSALIDKYAEAKKAGVSEDVLQEARRLHDIAHINWEWWTAENSDGFHNPEEAREALTRSIDTSQKAIKLLTDAMAQKLR